MLDHVEGKEMLAEPMQRRDQCAGQAGPTDREHQRLPRPDRSAELSPPPQRPRAQAIAKPDRQQRADDPWIERPCRTGAVLLATMRQHRAARRHREQERDRYRSHPLSTSEAIPCMDSAKAKISADSALIAPTKPEVAVSGATVCARRVACHDMAAATQVTSSATSETVAENRA